MTGWWASRRRLQARAEYLQLQLDAARKAPRLVVRPGPPPVPIESDTPEPVEANLRAQIRVLQGLKTVEGAQELSAEVRAWRERAVRLCDMLRAAETDNEWFRRELAALQTPMATVPQQREPGLG
ncbi:hypothetical protein ACGFZK_32625 [Streptomyces sp. NPDC048257]|uniref:hypothetical protein n=1 Tax=Streptomyces sp. NPDC048257 TaxID=3365526 RepID=UPI00371521AB